MPGDRRKPPSRSELFKELVSCQFRLLQNPDQRPFRQFRVVGHGDQDASLVVPQVNVTPRLPDDYESELPEDFQHFPRRQDGKLGQESDLDFHDPGAPTLWCQLEEQLVMFLESLHEIRQRLFPSGSLIDNVRD